MKLQSIDIKNFRCYRDFHLDFDDTTVLIGENNSGKTALLDAIRLCLRDAAQVRRSTNFEPYDLHLADGTADPTQAQPIQITLTFRERIPDEWEDRLVRSLRGIVQFNTATSLNEVVLRCTCQYDATTNDYPPTFAFLNLSGDPVPEPSGALANLRKQVPFFYLDALRDAAANFDPRGPFWKPFLQDSRLTDTQKAEIEEKLKEINNTMVAAHGSFAEVSLRLSRVQQVVPLSSGDVVSIEAVPGRIFDMLAKAQVSLGAPTGAKIPLGRHGEGTKSLSVLMLFRAFLEARPEGFPIVALEEPEAHLHPSAVRALWKLLEQIPGQKIISTHSGDILAEVPIEKVRRLHRTTMGITEHRLRPTSLSAEDRRRINFHIRYQRGELLFSRCWILVEGETEITLLPELARHLNPDFDFDRLGIRCIDYQHGAGLGSYLKVAADFGIRWCVLTDNDTQGVADYARAQANLGTNDATRALHRMSQKDIEQYLSSCGLTIPRGLAKPDAALHVLGQIQAGQPVPPLLKEVIESAVSLAKEG